MGALASGFDERGHERRVDAGEEREVCREEVGAVALFF